MPIRGVRYGPDAFLLGRSAEKGGFCPGSQKLSGQSIPCAEAGTGKRPSGFRGRASGQPLPVSGSENKIRGLSAPRGIFLTGQEEVYHGDHHGQASEKGVCLLQKGRGLKGISAQSVPSGNTDQGSGAGRVLFGGEGGNAGASGTKRRGQDHDIKAFVRHSVSYVG